MSESDDGASAAVTRQNAGRPVIGWPAPPRVPGGVNPPAPTNCASVIVMPARLNDDNDSHAAASGDPAAGTAWTADVTRTAPPARITATRTARTSFMSPPAWAETGWIWSADYRT